MAFENDLMLQGYLVEKTLLSNTFGTQILGGYLSNSPFDIFLNLKHILHVLGIAK